MNRFFKPLKYLGILTVVIVISAVITYIINPVLLQSLKIKYKVYNPSCS